MTEVMSMDIENVNLAEVQDEDYLRKLWQTTPDFNEKRRIRARMSKLREQRLKEFYMSNDVMGDTGGASQRATARDLGYEGGGGGADQDSDDSTHGTPKTSLMKSRDDNDSNRKRSLGKVDDQIREKLTRKGSERESRYNLISGKMEGSDYGIQGQGMERVICTPMEDIVSEIIQTDSMQALETSADGCSRITQERKPSLKKSSVSFREESAASSLGNMDETIDTLLAYDLDLPENLRFRAQKSKENSLNEKLAINGFDKHDISEGEYPSSTGQALDDEIDGRTQDKNKKRKGSQENGIKRKSKLKSRSHTSELQLLSPSDDKIPGQATGLDEELMTKEDREKFYSQGKEIVEEVAISKSTGYRLGHVGGDAANVAMDSDFNSQLLSETTALNVKEKQSGKDVPQDVQMVVSTPDTAERLYLSSLKSSEQDLSSSTKAYHNAPAIDLEADIVVSCDDLENTLERHDRVITDLVKDKTSDSLIGDTPSKTNINKRRSSDTTGERKGILNSTQRKVSEVVNSKLNRRPSKSKIDGNIDADKSLTKRKSSDSIQENAAKNTNTVERLVDGTGRKLSDASQPNRKTSITKLQNNTDKQDHLPKDPVLPKKSSLKNSSPKIELSDCNFQPGDIKTSAKKTIDDIDGHESWDLAHSQSEHCSKESLVDVDKTIEGLKKPVIDEYRSNDNSGDRCVGENGFERNLSHKNEDEDDSMLNTSKLKDLSDNISQKEKLVSDKYGDVLDKALEYNDDNIRRNGMREVDDDIKNLEVESPEKQEVVPIKKTSTSKDSFGSDTQRLTRQKADPDVDKDLTKDPNKRKISRPNLMSIGNNEPSDVQHKVRPSVLTNGEYAKNEGTTGSPSRKKSVTDKESKPTRDDKKAPTKEPLKKTSSTEPRKTSTSKKPEKEINLTTKSSNERNKTVPQKSTRSVTDTEKHLQGTSLRGRKLPGYENDDHIDDNPSSPIYYNDSDGQTEDKKSGQPDRKPSSGKSSPRRVSRTEEKVIQPAKKKSVEERKIVIKGKDPSPVTSPSEVKQRKGILKSPKTTPTSDSITYDDITKKMEETALRELQNLDDYLSETNKSPRDKNTDGLLGKTTLNVSRHDESDNEEYPTKEIDKSPDPATHISKFIENFENKRDSEKSQIPVMKNIYPGSKPVVVQSRQYTIEHPSYTVDIKEEITTEQTSINMLHSMIDSEEMERIENEHCEEIAALRNASKLPSDCEDLPTIKPNVQKNTLVPQREIFDRKLSPDKSAPISGEGDKAPPRKLSPSKFERWNSPSTQTSLPVPTKSGSKLISDDIPRRSIRDKIKNFNAVKDSGPKLPSKSPHGEMGERNKFHTLPKSDRDKVSEASLPSKEDSPTRNIVEDNFEMNNDIDDNSESQKKTGSTNDKPSLNNVPEGSITHPDGVIECPDGTFLYPDGVIEYPNGDLEHPNGTIECYDGTIKYPSDKEKVKDKRSESDPEISEGIVEHPDGTREYPDGKKRYPDGVVEYPDGTLEYPDGVIEHPDGIIEHPDGTLEHPDGVKELPNGSLEYPDGRIQREDGTLVHPDNTEQPKRDKSKDDKVKKPTTVKSQKDKIPSSKLSPKDKHTATGCKDKPTSTTKISPTRTSGPSKEGRSMSRSPTKENTTQKPQKQPSIDKSRSRPADKDRKPVRNKTISPTDTVTSKPSSLSKDKTQKPRITRSDSATSKMHPLDKKPSTLNSQKNLPTDQGSFRSKKDKPSDTKQEPASKKPVSTSQTKLSDTSRATRKDKNIDTLDKKPVKGIARSSKSPDKTNYNVKPKREMSSSNEHLGSEEDIPHLKVDKSSKNSRNDYSDEEVDEKTPLDGGFRSSKEPNQELLPEGKKHIKRSPLRDDFPTSINTKFLDLIDQTKPGKEEPVITPADKIEPGKKSPTESKFDKYLDAMRSSALEKIEAVLEKFDKMQEQNQKKNLDKTLLPLSNRSSKDSSRDGSPQRQSPLVSSPRHGCSLEKFRSPNRSPGYSSEDSRPESPTDDRNTVKLTGLQSGSIKDNSFKPIQEEQTTKDKTHPKNPTRATAKPGATSAPKRFSPDDTTHSKSRPVLKTQTSLEKKSPAPKKPQISKTNVSKPATTRSPSPKKTGSIKDNQEKDPKKLKRQSSQNEKKEVPATLGKRPSTKRISPGTTDRSKPASSTVPPKKTNAEPLKHRKPSYTESSNIESEVEELTGDKHEDDNYEPDIEDDIVRKLSGETVERPVEPLDSEDEVPQNELKNRKPSLKDRHPLSKMKEEYYDDDNEKAEPGRNKSPIGDRSPPSGLKTQQKANKLTDRIALFTKKIEDQFKTEGSPKAPRKFDRDVDKFSPSPTRRPLDRSFDNSCSDEEPSRSPGLPDVVRRSKDKDTFISRLDEQISDEDSTKGSSQPKNKFSLIDNKKPKSGHPNEVDHDDYKSPINYGYLKKPHEEVNEPEFSPFNRSPGDYPAKVKSTATLILSPPEKRKNYPVLVPNVKKVSDGSLKRPDDAFTDKIRHKESPDRTFRPIKDAHCYDVTEKRPTSRNEAFSGDESHPDSLDRDTSPYKRSDSLCHPGKGDKDRDSSPTYYDKPLRSSSPLKSPAHRSSRLSDHPADSEGELSETSGTVSPRSVSRAKKMFESQLVRTASRTQQKKVYVSGNVSKARSLFENLSRSREESPPLEPNSTRRSPEFKRKPNYIDKDQSFLSDRSVLSNDEEDYKSFRSPMNRSCTNSISSRVSTPVEDGEPLTSFKLVSAATHHSRFSPTAEEDAPEDRTKDRYSKRPSRSSTSKPGSESFPTKVSTSTRRVPDRDSPSDDDLSSPERKPYKSSLRSSSKTFKDQHSRTDKFQSDIKPEKDYPDRNSNSPVCDGRDERVTHRDSDLSSRSLVSSRKSSRDAPIGDSPARRVSRDSDQSPSTKKTWTSTSMANDQYPHSNELITSVSSLRKDSKDMEDEYQRRHQPKQRESERSSAHSPLRGSSPPPSDDTTRKLSDSSVSRQLPDNKQDVTLHRSDSKTFRKFERMGSVKRLTSRIETQSLVNKMDPAVIDQIEDIEQLNQMLEEASDYDLRFRIRTQIRKLRRLNGESGTTSTPSSESKPRYGQSSSVSQRESSVGGQRKTADRGDKISDGNQSLLPTHKNANGHSDDVEDYEDGYDIEYPGDESTPSMKASFRRRVQETDTGHVTRTEASYSSSYGLQTSSTTGPDGKTVSESRRISSSDDKGRFRDGLIPRDSSGKPMFGLAALKSPQNNPKDSLSRQESEKNNKGSNKAGTKIAQNNGVDTNGASDTYGLPLFGGLAALRKKKNQQMENGHMDGALDSDGATFSDDGHRPQSFLDDRTPVKGIQDIVSRMKVGDEAGEAEDDPRNLLNKFLGAQMLYTGAESILKSHNTKVGSGMSTPDLVDNVNLSAINDESILRDMLDNCKDSDDEKKLKSRIKMLRSGGSIDSKEKKSHDFHEDDSKVVREWLKNNYPETKGTGKYKGSAVVEHTSSRSVISSRTMSSREESKGPISPFAKFKQMDAANSKSPASSSKKAVGGPIYKFTNPALNRSASDVKDMLLYWCQCRTRDYKNVKIENFSTSWSDGLAFCALIHHFFPDSFDYDQLTPNNRKHNFTLAFKLAEEKANIAPLLEVDDMVRMKKPDWKCVFTYVQSMYRTLKDM